VAQGPPPPSHRAVERGPLAKEVNVSNRNGTESRAHAEGGQALVEYALIIAFVAIVCAGVLGALGTGVSGIIQQMASAF
jgi:Flp pilus assembly pilin Flp